jgi:hypothetical protein
MFASLTKKVCAGVGHLRSHMNILFGQKEVHSVKTREGEGGGGCEKDHHTHVQLNEPADMVL